MIYCIYFSIIFLCFVASIYNKVARQRFFWMYFLVILVLEMGLFFNFIPYKIYILSFFIYIPYILYIYSQNLKNKSFHTFVGFLSLITSLVLYFSQKNYQIQLGLIMSFTYILIAILWFFSQLRKTDHIPIIKKQLFWMSTSLLLIGIVSIFRLVPMYYFNEEDKNFLIIISKIHQYSIIVSYIIFFKGLFCKQ